MHVFMLTERYSPIWGGAENQLRQLIPGLQQRGCRIIVLTRRWHQGYPVREVVEGAEVVRLGQPGTGYFKTLVFVMSLCWYIIRNRRDVDILHSHGAVNMGALCAFWSMLFGLKNVAKIASADRIPRLAGKFWGTAILAIFKKSSAIISMTEEIDRELDAIRARPDRIVRITNGVDCERFKPADPEVRTEWRHSRNLAGNCPVILFSSRLVPGKGLDVLLDGWPAIHDGQPEAWLYVVGSGNDQPDSAEQQLKQRVEDEALEHVSFVGETETPENYLGIADIFVFPSRREGYPNAMLEAMAAGLAVVASDIGGVQAVLCGSRNGITFTTEDGSQLTEVVLNLLENPDQIRRLGQQARLMMLENNSFEKISTQYHELYAHLMTS